MRLVSYRSPIGEIVFSVSAGALRALDFVDFTARVEARLALHRVALPDPTGTARVHAALDAYFSGDLEALDALDVDAIGTPFQRRVWDALREIPAATHTSYGELAKRIGKPSAARAVGAANGQNPVALVVPCHRVIGKDGSLTGYACGIERKRWLLDHEARFAKSAAAS